MSSSHHTRTKVSRRNIVPEFIGWLRGGLIGLCGAGVVSAQVLYWDTNSTTSGAGSSPTGTWANNNAKANRNWTTNSAGTSGTIRWNNGRDAVFSAGTDSTWATYNVTVSGTVKPGSINVEEGNVTFNSGSIQFNDATPDFTVATGRTATINSARITGGNGITKLGDGTLVFASTANTYTGNTTISDGILQLNTSNQIADSSDVTIDSGGTLQFNWGSLSETVDSLSGSGTLSLRGSTFTTNTSDSTTFSGTITDSYGNFRKDGTGTLTLDGSSTYSGKTYIDAGTLVAASNNALGASTWGNEIANGATLGLQGGTTLTEGQFSVAGSGVSGLGAIRNLSGNNTLDASLTISSAATVGSDSGALAYTGSNLSLTSDLTIVGAGDTSISSQIYGSSSLTKSGTGTLTLSGSGSNSWSGGANIDEGTVILSKSAGTSAIGQGVLNVGNSAGAAGTATLQLGADNQIADYISMININSDGVLDLDENTESINVFSGTGDIDFGTSGQLTVGVYSGSSTFGGSFSGSGELTKAGSGTLTFDSDLDFDGTVFLNAGTLDLGDQDVSLGTLHITGNSIIDFGSGLASSLTVNQFEIDAGATLTIKNWVDTTDFFIADGWTGATQDTTDAAPMNQIIFNGFGASDTHWSSDDHQITPNPVPEPSTYGLILIGVGAVMSGLRRFHRHARISNHRATLSAPTRRRPALPTLPG